MKRLFYFILIVTLLWVYTTYKLTVTFPYYWASAPQITSCIFLVMIAWMFIYRTKPNLLNNILFISFAWAGTITMGVWTTFILLSIPIDIIFLINYLISKFIVHSYILNQFAESYQKTNFYLLVFTILISLIGLLQTLLGPRVKNIKIKLTNLPAALNNFTIAQISDLHIGPTIRNAYIERVVQLVNQTNPDVVVLTGDLADALTKDINAELHTLSKLKSKFGTFAITGNHEYYWDTQALLSKLENLGIKLLINQNAILNVNGLPVMIAGITDPVGRSYSNEHAPDMKRASETSENANLKILLSHRPGVFEKAESLGFDLQLSGHTHAGQFFPMNLIMPLFHKYFSGLNKFGRLWIYVNSGTGYWGPANRFGIPAEISLLRLSGTI